MSAVLEERVERRSAILLIPTTDSSALASQEAGMFIPEQLNITICCNVKKILTLGDYVSDKVIHFRKSLTGQVDKGRGFVLILHLGCDCQHSSKLGSAL